MPRLDALLPRLFSSCQLAYLVVTQHPAVQELGHLVHSGWLPILVPRCLLPLLEGLNMILQSDSFVSQYPASYKLQCDTTAH